MRENKIRQNRYRDNEPEDPAKRKTLKILGGAAASIVVGSAAFEGIEKIIKLIDQDTVKVVNAADEDMVETERQKEIAAADAKSIYEILDFDKPGPIHITKENIKEIEKYWWEMYKDGERHQDLINAFKDIGEWQPYLEEQFRKVFDDKFAAKYGEHAREHAIKLFYLAIPESHWDVNAVSAAKAVGPFQFTGQTAKDFNLHVGNGVDERKDPIKSATACAEVLKELYVATRDWDLTLSGYNGGFAWKYLKKARKNNEPVSYMGLVKYLEDKINVAKSHIEQKKHTSHKQKEQEYLDLIAGYAENLNYPAKYYAVYSLIKDKVVTEQKEAVKFREVQVSNPERIYKIRKGDNLLKIAGHFRVDAETLRRYNGISKKHSKLIVGHPLKIPTRLTLANYVKGDVTMERLASLNPALDPKMPIPDNYIIRV
jgi:LysM repeat protein